MPSYRVRFINEIPRNERLFRCCQRSIIIQSASSAERAVEAAKEQFAKLEGIGDWKIHAALIELEPIDIAEEPQTPSKLLTSHTPRAISPTKALIHEKDVRYRKEPGPGHPSTERNRKRGLPIHARPPRRRRPRNRG